MATGLAPSVRKIEHLVPATAGGADATFVIAVAPFDGVVTAVEYLPVSTITGADTNSRTVSVENAGAAGSGTTSVASLALTSGVNATGKTPKAVTLSGTAANREVNAGAALVWKSTHVGTGLADPGGLVRITISRS